MTILHVCAISGKKSSGMSVVIPEHIKNQSKFENVAMFNCVDYVPSNAKNSYKVFLKKNYKKFSITNLEKPFNNPDIVIFHGVYIPFYIKIYKDLKKNNIPYIILPHGSLTKEAQKIKKIKKRIFNFLVFNKFIAGANYIQYLSETERERSSKYQKESFVLGNGIHVPKEKLKKYRCNESIKLIYIGRLDLYSKGLDILIEAVDFIKKEMRDRNAIINLYGPLDRKTKKIKNFVKKYKIEDILKVNDAIYETEKERVLLDNDVFIQISRTEGQPLGIMEAMSYGLPCIVTPGTTFKNIVEKNKCGYTTELEKEQVANTILYAIEHLQELESLSNSAYTYAKNNLEWELIAKKTIEKYNKIQEEV